MKPLCLAEKLVGRIGGFIKSGNNGKVKEKRLVKHWKKKCSFHGIVVVPLIIWRSKVVNEKI